MQAQPISIKSITFLCCLFFNTSFAQFYPVQITPQLVPPYSVYLSDYATPGNEKLRVIVLQKDLAQPAYQLRLTMSVEWNGKVIMRTAKTFNPAPINIDPGIPTIISGADLAPYLDSRNIDFVGYNREQYERTRALPEGSYRIFFTAYDYRRQDVQVSNEGSSFYYLSKNEPPLINFPACGTRIQLKDPQQIIFSWLPRNTSSPNSVAETEYEFTLFETRPAGRNPNDVINTTQPIFRTRTDVTQLVYGPAEPLLMEGMKYVWRVQAIDKNGRDAFRNNGFSEVCTFTYGGGDAAFDIGVVKNLQAIGETERRAKISWEAENYDHYKVYYKKTGSNYEWFWSEVKNTEFKLFDLEPDTEYETRVQVKKSGVFGPYSEIIKFRTTPIRVVECGQENGALAKGDVNKPLDAAHKGMTVDVDGIKMTLLEVMPLGGGWFKGMGTATTKLLGASFHVKFDRLFIDENHIAGFGRIDFISKGVAQLVQQQMVNLQKKEEQKQQAQNRDQWKDLEFQDKIFKYDMLIADISFDNGTVTIIDSEGNSFPNNEIPQMLIDAPEKVIIIEDKNGDQWVVQKDENGNTKATKVSGGGLVVGQDGKMVDEKTLGGLYSKILTSLRKYKKVIDEYQASIQQTQPGKGGGPSLEEDEIEMLLAELPQCLAPHKDQFNVISTNIVTYGDSGSTASLKFAVDVSKILAPAFPTVTDKNNAPLEKVSDAVCEALGTSSWEGSSVYQFYYALFNFIYEKNHIGGFLESEQLIYLNEIESILHGGPSKEALDLDYNGSGPIASWINSWKIRVVDSKTVLDNTIKVIQEANKGEKIGTMHLKPKHIYIAKYNYNNHDYPIAIYNSGNQEIMTKLFTKVEITEFDRLKSEENKKKIHVEETGLKYFIVSFYEEGQYAPTVFMQVEKFFGNNSMEEWLKFLRILIDDSEKVTEEVFLDEVEYVSQFDESIFGLCTGCWTTSCCRRATEYMMGNTNIANCTDSTIAAKAPYMTVLGSIVTASFSNNSTIYTKDTYNAAVLNGNSKNAKDALDYLSMRLRDRKPVLIGVHYTNGTSTPPNNNNRATRHFMVVVGMQKKGNIVKFRFYDPGRSSDNSDKATSSDNQLTYHEDLGFIQGAYYNKTYTITEVVKTN